MIDTCPNCRKKLTLECTEFMNGEAHMLMACDACGFSAPKNHLVIQELYAYVSVDPEDQNEGIIAMATPSGPLPLVGADIDRMKSLRKVAEDVAERSKIQVKLLRFSVREEIEVIW